MIIDSHVHFWKYNSKVHSWISEEMQILRQNFTPDEYKKISVENNISGCIAVQAEQSENETKFLLQLTDQYKIIDGVVGWVNLMSNDLMERLLYFSQFEKVKGFRHILQAEKSNFMLHPAFLTGIKLLHSFDYSYDILIDCSQINSAIKLISKNPEQAFVIDHIAKPNIKKGEIEIWKKGIKSFSSFKNVSCKVSGIITEADWQSWHYCNLIPYLDVVLQAFGTKRLMYGSDWPVCLLAASYKDTLNITREYFSLLSYSEQEDIYFNNARSFYKLNNHNKKLHLV